MNFWIDINKIYQKGSLTKAQLEAREIAANSLEAFIDLCASFQVMSHCHRDLCKWVQEHERDNKLVLWPRDHGKSRYSAFYAAWNIVRNPAVTIIYASATAEKAEEQMRFIKSILVSKAVRKYFPGLTELKEGQRKMWNNTAIIVDHPYRDKQGVVDSTIMTCGINKTITGKHCDKLILDDIVVPENNNEEGRKTVNKWVAQAASIMSAESDILAVGTRYHPKDAYGMMLEMEVEAYESEDGEEEGRATPLFLVNQANVEQEGDFLWPRQQSKDGRWFGFNGQILNKKKAIYVGAGEVTQFFAQYYNDPNDKSTAPISRDLFKYYKKDSLSYMGGVWSVDGDTLDVYCAVDLAASASKRADYTALTVGGIDGRGNRYLLYATRMRTDKMSDILDAITIAYDKYKFRSLRIEAVAGFKLVAEDLALKLREDKLIRIPYDIYVPPRNEGKIARIHSILEPLYRSGAMYHYRGGHSEILEEELVSLSPAHDDLKDAWASTCDPSFMRVTRRRVAKKTHNNVVKYHPRFGGVL